MTCMVQNFSHVTFVHSLLQTLNNSKTQKHNPSINVNEMSNLFSRSFHCLWFPCSNLPPPKPPSQTLLPFSPSTPLPRRFFTFTTTHHPHILPSSTSSSTPSPQEHEELDVISSTGKLHLSLKLLAFFFFLSWVFVYFPFWLVVFFFSSYKS